MKTKTKSPSYLTSAKTMYAALTILKKNGGSMPIRVLMREIENTVDLTDWEKEILESTGNIRWMYEPDSSLRRRVHGRLRPKVRKP